MSKIIHIYDPSTIEKLYKALDALGLALDGHDHTWTEREYDLYNEATEICFKLLRECES